MDALTNVLYLSYDGMTDPLGQSQVLPYLRGLAKEGYSIHLVSFEKPDKFLRHQNHIQRICDEVGIQWHPQDYVIGGSILTTLRQVKRMQRIAFYLHDKHHFSIIHCRSYIAALAGLKLKQKKGTKFIFDMRGFWADERVDGGLWNLKNPLYRTIYRYFKGKEIQFFKEADQIISLTHNGKSEIESWKKLAGYPLKIEVIPCCVDLDLFDPTQYPANEKEQTRKALGLDSTSYVLGYVGSIGTWYMLPEMLAYFKTVKKSRPSAKFLFVTGEKPEIIQAEARKQGIDSEDLLCVSVLHKDVPSHIAIFDASVFFIRPTYSKKASSPTKQGEIMAMGVPLVCNSGIGDTSEIVETNHSGVVIHHFTKEEFEQANAKLPTFDAKEIAAGAHAIFSLEQGVKQYLSTYKFLEQEAIHT